jgi:hypothetical protein
MALKHCPVCNSSKIHEAISLENGIYVKRIECKNKKCGYSNKQDLGSAEKS